VEAASLLRELLDRTRLAKLLVTSRERLRLQEEWLIDLGGLAVPDAGGSDPRDFSAVQLFAQRARQVRADFVLEGDDLAAVVAICRLVEGMPLAIELAAAWVRALTPAEIARDLAQSMALLTTTLRDVPERHRSVEGVFMQAWERLSEPERDALRRLSVFEDGFTRQAATEVAGATPVVLAALTDKALIRRERSGRYAIHELLRQMVARNLAADPAAERETMLRFCRFAMDLLARRNEDLNGRHQILALADLDAEYDNLWNAWDWAVGAGLLDALASGLDGFYALHAMRGWYRDGIQVLGRLLDGLGHLPESEESAVLRARAQARLGMLCSWVGQFGAAEQHLAAALPTLRARGLAHDAAFALLGLGVVASERDEQQALRLIQESLEIYQRLADQPGVAWALDALGDIAGSLGDYARARELFSESSMIYTALGDQLSAAWGLCNLGRVIGLMGDPAAARQLLEEALVIFEALGDRHGVAAAHNNLAEIAHGAPDPPRARAHWLAALRIAVDLGAAPLVIDVLVGAAGLLVSAGDYQAAHELAALALDHPASWKETVSIARGLADLTAHALGPQAAAAARRGQATSLEQAAARLLRLWGDEDQG
jgi:tetratricopeptide (TPR) repeat protein